MTEGRKSQIVLLDERRLDIIIQPKLYTNELLDLVSSHFKLKEKQYFGLAFIDDTGHYNWLNLEKRVLDHDFPKRSGLLILHFSVRFYIETVGLLRDSATVELFYFNARQALFKGQIECDSETVFELAAHVLQATHGDFVSEQDTKSELKKLPVIPTSSLKEHPSIGFCEDRVIYHYQKLAGTSRGLAIVNYMNIVERLPTYGIHCYEVKDKKDIPWWLGISPKGISVFDKNDKTTPRRIFTWKQLENLYYRDKKFSIEVHDPKRVSVSRRTFGPGNVNVHAWLAATHQLTKCIWSMAVAQHQFYLDRKQSKGLLPTARSMSEIAADLSRSTTSLPGSIGSDLSRSASSQSLPSLTTSRFDLNIEQSDSIKAQRDMYHALKARKEALEETLRKKTEELKRLCFQEGELTGELPAETPLAPGEQVPTFRRRVGTSFSLSARVVNSSDEKEDKLAKMELEYELQSKITSAAHKLAQDKSVSKSVRKQRRQSYTRALAKLKEMEKKVNEMRKIAGKIGVRTTSSYDDSEIASPAQSPPVQRIQREHQAQRPQSFHHQQPPDHVPLPPEPQAVPPHVTLSPSHSSPQLSGGYMPSNVYTTRTHYRSQMYPTFTSRSHSSSSNQSEYDNMRTAGRLEGSQDSGFSSANNMYNIASQRTSHYESTDALKTPNNPDVYGQGETVYDERLNLLSKHGSLDGAYRKGGQKYNSLELGAQQGYCEDDVQLPELTPSRFGSKRESQTEYEYETPVPHGNIVEVPVHHEESDQSHSGNRTFFSDRYWQDSLNTEPSPIVRSPEQEHVEVMCQSESPCIDQCYSPRGYEGSYSRTGQRLNYPSVPSYEHSVKRVESQPKKAQSSTLVTVTRLQPHMEVTKPYEMADFYKYSERLRRQRLIDQYQRQLIGTERLSRSSTPSQHSSDGDSTTHTTSVSYQMGNSSLGHPTSPYRSPQSPSYSSTGIPQTGYMQQRRDYEQSPYGGNREVSSTYHSVKSHGPGVQYAVQSMSYKAQHVQSASSTKHTVYQPLQRMTCEPVKNVSAYSSSASSGSPR